MEIISVIVPIYNVKNDLRAAMESLRAQSFGDFRVWLVDDGSTDGSGAVCDELAREDARFCVLRQKNSGAHAARNTALANCQGEYVYFMDADDLIERKPWNGCCNVPGQTDGDIAVCGYQIEYRRAGHLADCKSVPGFDGYHGHSWSTAGWVDHGINLSAVEQALQTVISHAVQPAFSSDLLGRYDL